MTSMSTKYALLKEQYNELKEKYDLLKAKLYSQNKNNNNNIEEINEGTNNDINIDNEFQSVNLCANCSTGYEVADSQNQTGHFPEEILLIRDRYKSLLRHLQASHDDIITIERSWQFVADFFCLYTNCKGQSRPGRLIIYYHSMVFNYTDKRRGAVHFNFPDCRAVGISPWGIHSARSLHLYEGDRNEHVHETILEKSDYLLVPKTVHSKVENHHIFWGFENEIKDCEFITEVISSSFLSSHKQSSKPIEENENDQQVYHKRIVEVYENERYLTSVLGWSSAFLLATNDPPAFCRRDGINVNNLEYAQKAVEKDDWIWLSDWDVDTGVIGVIKSIQVNSPAYHARLEPEDVVVRFRSSSHISNNIRHLPVNQTYQLFTHVVKNSIGEPLELTIFRNSNKSWLVTYITPQHFNDSEAILGCAFHPSNTMSQLQGWEYGISFNQTHKFSKVAQPKCLVRRRRWIREALVPGNGDKDESKNYERLRGIAVEPIPFEVNFLSNQSESELVLGALTGFSKRLLEIGRNVGISAVNMMKHKSEKNHQRDDEDKDIPTYDLDHPYWDIDNEIR